MIKQILIWNNHQGLYEIQFLNHYSIDPIQPEIFNHLAFRLASQGLSSDLMVWAKLSLPSLTSKAHLRQFSHIYSLEFFYSIHTGWRWRLLDRFGCINILATPFLRGGSFKKHYQRDRALSIHLQSLEGKCTARHCYPRMGNSGERYLQWAPYQNVSRNTSRAHPEGHKQTQNNIGNTTGLTVQTRNPYLL